MLKEHNLLSVAVAAAVVCSLFLISTAPGAASSPDSSQPGLGREDHGDLKDLKKVKRWQREHTTTVQVKKIYTYSREKSALSVKTVYTGGRLKEIIGSGRASFMDTIPVKPSRLKEFQGKLGLGKKKFRRLLDQKSVRKDGETQTITVTTANDPPNWYEYYKYPQWTYSKDVYGYIYIQSDPINLAWQGESWNDSVPEDKVVEEIKDPGNPWGNVDIQGTQYVYDYYDDGWEQQSHSLATGTGTRYHVRLFTITKAIWGGHKQIIVGSAHHEELGLGHGVTSFEDGEDEVTAYFHIYSPIDYNWSVDYDSYDLGNGNTDVPNDGLATEISEE